MQPAFKDVASVAHYQRFTTHVQGCWPYLGHTLAALFHQVYCRAGGPALRDPRHPPEDTNEAIEILTILNGLYEADLLVVSELAHDAAHALWKSGAAR
jgi:hypothetical protein